MRSCADLDPSPNKFARPRRRCAAMPRVLAYPCCAYCGLQIRTSTSRPCPAELPPKCVAFARAAEAAGDPDVAEVALRVSNLERPVDTAAMEGACPTVCLSASRFPRALPTCAEWLLASKLVRSRRDVAAVADVSPEDASQAGAVKITFRDKEVAADARTQLHGMRYSSATMRAVFDKSHHKLHHSAGKQCRTAVFTDVDTNLSGLPSSRYLSRCIPMPEDPSPTIKCSKPGTASALRPLGHHRGWSMGTWHAAQ